MEIKEVWKDIRGYEGLYQVSNLGRVKSIDRKILQFNGYSYSYRIYRGKILKQSVKHYYQNNTNNNICLSCSVPLLSE